MNLGSVDVHADFLCLNAQITASYVSCRVVPCRAVNSTLTY
jgi:hypothetical protein